MYNYYYAWTAFSILNKMDTAKGKIENQVKVQVETLDVLDLDLPTTEYQHNIMISLFYTMYFLYMYESLIMIIMSEALTWTGTLHLYRIT